MQQGKYSGYPITLHSPHSAEECLRRLDAEFYDKRGNWHHALSDKRLLGWQEKGAFVIYLSWRFDFFDQAISFRRSNSWDMSRVCHVRLRPPGDGCTVSGIYRYARGEQLLMVMMMGILPAFIVGLLFTIAGIVGLFTTLSAFWLLLIGVAMLAACVALILDRGDDKFPQERDHIARFLARVLEAKIAPESKPVPRPSVRVVR